MLKGQGAPRAGCARWCVCWYYAGVRAGVRYCPYDAVRCHLCASASWAHASVGAMRPPAGRRRTVLLPTGFFANTGLGLLFMLVCFGTTSGAYGFNDGRGDKQCDTRLEAVYRNPYTVHGKLVAASFVYIVGTFVVAGASRAEPHGCA